MTTSELLEFLRAQRLAVQASVAAGNSVQAALMGIAVTDAFELVFDTIDSSRKCRNLRRVPNVTFVIGDVERSCAELAESRSPRTR